MSYLLDTNAVSEVMRRAPQPAVLAWLERHEDECFLSAVTVGEIERGIYLLPSGQKKNRLQEAYETFAESFDHRFLSFDQAVARRWAVLADTARKKGRTLSVMDSMIEATALHWGLTLVTRNMTDFFEVPMMNPWQP